MTSEGLVKLATGGRLDRALLDAFPGYSRSMLNKLIINGDILVNGEKAKSSYILKSDDKVNANFNSLNRKQANLSLEILYENKDLVVINKPSGVLTHSKSSFPTEPTVADWLLVRIGKAPGRHDDLTRRGIVHRLDRGTSGVMVCAKNDQTRQLLQKQFQSRQVEKTYQAVVYGRLKRPEAIIDTKIDRNPKRPTVFRVSAKGKPARTYYRVLKNSSHRPATSLVELKPETGRTHQLRVHMSYIGHPIAGDTFYGDAELPPYLTKKRLYLHAQSLKIKLPDEKSRTFVAKTPDEFEI